MYPILHPHAVHSTFERPGKANLDKSQFENLCVELSLLPGLNLNCLEYPGAFKVLIE